VDDEMINIVTIDGGSGSLRGSKIGLQFKRMLRCYDKTHIVTSYLRSAMFPIMRAIRKRKLRKRVLRYNAPENTLVIAGKSLGGVWAIDVLEDLNAEMQYANIYLCLIDTPKLLDADSSYPMNANISQGWNVYQQHDWPHGSRIDHLKVENILVKRKTVVHWNIIFCKESELAMQWALESAISSL
jgi:hypothetical protein